MKRTTKIIHTATTALFMLFAMCGFALAQGEGADYKAQKLADSYGTIGIAAALAISIAALVVVSVRAAPRPPRSTASPATRTPPTRSAAR